MIRRPLVRLRCLLCRNDLVFGGGILVRGRFGPTESTLGAEARVFVGNGAIEGAPFQSILTGVGKSILNTVRLSKVAPFQSAHPERVFHMVLFKALASSDLGFAGGARRIGGRQCT